MSNVLCYSIDAESETGAPIAKQFSVRGFPALIFLNADGSVRDRISGYMPPDPFIAELGRIGRDEDTYSGLKKQVAANPKDVDARWKLAQKLRGMGDIAGYEAQVAAIRELDPEGKSLAMRSLALEDLLAGVQKSLDPTSLYEFAAGETDPGLSFQVWYAIWRIEAMRTERAGDDAEKAQLRGKWLAAGRSLWKHTPAERHGSFGNQLAWTLYEQTDVLGADDKAFALEVARVAAKAAGDDPNTLDTLACCLHMNGKTEEALAIVKRCIELEPDNGEWQRRLEQLSS